jgi:hypothetical protein
MDQQIITLREAAFWIAGIIGLGIYKFLCWAMPKTGQIFYLHVKQFLLEEISKEIKSMKGELKILSSQLSNYRDEKHKMEGELKECIDAIVNNDHDKLEIFKNHYGKK